MAERIDNIGFGDLKLIQEPSEFCYGVDAVILADFAAKHASGPVRQAVDLGTGTGVIPLILSWKTDADMIAGLEIQEDSYDRAVRNAKMNGLESRISFYNGDVKTAVRHELAHLCGRVDMVTSNPPYMPGTGGLKCANRAKSIARHETTAGLVDFFLCAAALLKPKGDLFMVHRPSRLADLCCFARDNGLEPKEICFVSPNLRKAPNIVLLHYVKGGGRQLRFLDPLYVYKEDGTYTESLRECYK